MGLFFGERELGSGGDLRGFGGLQQPLQKGFGPEDPSLPPSPCSFSQSFTMKGSASQDDFKFKVSWPFCHQLWEEGWREALFIGPWGSALGSALLPGPRGASLGVRLGSGGGQLSARSHPALLVLRSPGVLGETSSTADGFQVGWAPGGFPVLDPLWDKLEGSPLPCAGCQICMENWAVILLRPGGASCWPCTSPEPRVVL